MADLILVESPNKVESVIKYAEAAGLASVKVLGTRGHLLDLPPMREGLCVDMTTWEPTAVVPRDDQAAARLGRIKAVIREADRVLVATDGDREGEGIASEVWDLIPRGNAFRCVFEEITPAGVRKGLQALRDIDQPLVEASKSRRLLDRVFGFYASQLTFAKLPGMKTSAGRVQSPTLRLCVDRWKEVQAFKPETTFVLRARLRHTAPDGTAREFEARVLENAERLTFKSKEAAKAFGLPSSLVCSKAEGREKDQKPKPPFTNSSWLQVAQKALRLPVGKASDAIQNLFEAGSTTYPRTDSVRVSDEAITWAREELVRRFGADFVPAHPWEHKDKAGVQGAHEAIRPTVPHGKDREHDPALEEAFRLIEARFLASQAAARRVRETVLRFPGPEGMVLEARGLVELFPGWKKVLQVEAMEEDDEPLAKGKADPEEETQGSLPPVQEGDLVEVLEVLVDQKTTRPPPLFTQASLVAELERRKIGRPSTFRSMVELILVRSFVQEQVPETKGREKKDPPIPVLVPTEVGVPLCEFLVQALPEFLDYAWTARIEAGLDKVESGSLERPTFLGVIWKRLEIALQIASSLPTLRPARKEFGPCPKCQADGRDGRLLLKKGRRKDSEASFEFAGCSLDSKESRPCGYRADTQDGVPRPALPCPACSSPMRAVERKDGGHSWVCETHGWHLAGKNWSLVKPPPCPECKGAMAHHHKKDDAKAFFWACFDHKKFHDSDKWGKVLPPKQRKGA
jgi:DNA topoisomerase-1